MRDPEGFAAQDLRRNNFIEMNRKSKIPKTAVALPVLQCKMFFDLGNELFYDDPRDTDPTVSWSSADSVELSFPQVAAFSAPTRQRKFIIIEGDIIFGFEQNAISVLEGKASMLNPPVGGFVTLLIELCASKNFKLTEQVPYRSVAPRITDKEDLTVQFQQRPLSLSCELLTKMVSRSISGRLLIVQLVVVGDTSMRLWAAKQAP